MFHDDRSFLLLTGAALLKNIETTTVCRAVSDTWIPCYGAPEMLSEGQGS